MRYLDTNVFLRHLTNDDPTKARACYALFQRLERGEEEATTSETVIAEITYVLSSPRLYSLTASDIRDRLVPLIALRRLKIAHKRVILQALDLYASAPALDFTDALSIAYMRSQHIAEVYTYDKDFDGRAGITRLEPPSTD